MTPRENFINALTFGPPQGRVPHFEMVFFLTMEAFGQVHPSQRNYVQWQQMSAPEKQAHRNNIADLFIATAERFDHSAIFIHPNPDTTEEKIRLIDLIREKSGDRYYIMLYSDTTDCVPDGDHMMDYCAMLADEPEKHRQRCRERAEREIEKVLHIQAYCGLDGVIMCSDYCMNDGPFLSPGQFADFVAPELSMLIEAYRAAGLYTIKHTDGNIMPILDQLIECRPHALHSLDPQGGVDIAEVKRRCGRKVALVGNVNCGVLDTGTEEEVADSVRYALRHGMPGGGYIFSTSNCIYTGMSLARYESMLDIWRREGNY